MRRIAVFTTTRADFGVHAPLLERLKDDPDCRAVLFVGGTHMAAEHGRTEAEITPRFTIADTFDFFLNEDSDYALTKSLGIASFELARIFRDHHFDMVCVLGDRFEMLPIVTAAILHGKPILHLFGGEVSEGALDEQVRHMISKAAHIHCVSCRQYADNVAALGEEPWRIHVTGSLAADSMMHIDRIAKPALFEELGLAQNMPTALLTYHPVTLESVIPSPEQINALFAALDGADLQVLITAPNVDRGREEIAERIRREVAVREHFHYVHSLGARRFHSLVPHCAFVIGNSSSGIAEVPFYRIPTINIGDRQRGRLRHPSVLDCGYGASDIRAAIHRALDPDFRASLEGMPFKFGDGRAADRIRDVIATTEINATLMKKQLVKKECA